MMDSEANNDQLHIFFLPFLARGHIIPLLDTARLLAECSVRATIVTTPGNASSVLDTIDEATQSGLSMHLLLIPFPSADVGLPQGCESRASFTPTNDDLLKFYHGINLLQQPFEQLLRDHRPDCIISDSLFFWPADLAFSLGIPHLQFNVCSPFSKCIIENIQSHGTHLASPSSDAIGPLVGLPHRIELTRSELPIIFNYPHVFDMTWEAERKSCGLLFNSFYELAPEYVEQCKMGGKRKVWCVGPVRLYKMIDADEDADHRDPNYGTWERIRSWLDSKDPESVLYVSFGSECLFKHDQLREIALGLETSGHPFIWVVRGGGGGAETMAEWLPEGFEQRVEGKGLILTEWAPQILILNHPAMGGFVMHCGWNSSVEAVSAGLPVIAWPLHSEQFINERLIVEVLGIGQRILEGAMRAVEPEGKGLVTGEKVREVVDRLMGDGEEASIVRRSAKEYKKLARSAMEKGGSSYVNLNSLIEEITVLADEKRKVAPLGGLAPQNTEKA